MKQPLIPGVPYPGVLSITENPDEHIGAFITLDLKAGLVVEVPYVHFVRGGQFDFVRKWVDGREVPSSLRFMSDTYAFELYSIRVASSVARYGSVRASNVRLHAREALVAQKRRGASTSFTAERIQSILDGISTWNVIRSVTHSMHEHPDSHSNILDLHLEVPAPMEWHQGEAQMRILGNWRTESSVNEFGRSRTVYDEVLIESGFQQERPFEDHVREQNKVAQLLRLLHGRPLAFRHHRALVEPDSPNWAEAISDLTLDQRLLDPVPDKNLAHGLADLESIGTNGLERWSNNYESWNRFISPAASIMQRSNNFVEDEIISTSMAIEGASSNIGKMEGEAETYYKNRPTTSTHFYRALTFTGLDCSQWDSKTEDVAARLADAYNTTKHADRGDFLSIDIGSIASSVNRLLVRLIALKIIDPDLSILNSHELTDRTRDITYWLQETGVSFGSEAWESLPK